MEKRHRSRTAKQKSGDGLLGTFHYRYLIGLFVKRDLFAIYKQTILGPLWFTLQPLLTTLTFTIVFGLFAQIPTGGYPPFIFYFSGIVCWNCFSTIAIKISNSFIENMPVFSKVYFPRLTAPIAATISNFSISLIQYVILLIVAGIYIVSGTTIPITYRIVFTPFLMLLSALMGLGVGLVFAAGTVKYRDLLHLLTFAMTLWMYATPIIYPLSMIPAAYRFLVYLNPVTGVVQSFKYCLFGIGQPDLSSLLYSVAFTAIVLLVGFVGFEKVQKNFVDTI